MIRLLVPLTLLCLITCLCKQSEIEEAAKAAFSNFSGEKVVNLDSLELDNPIIFQYPDQNCDNEDVTSVVVYYKIKNQKMYAEFHGWYSKKGNIFPERAGVAIDSAFFEIKTEYERGSFPLIHFECDEP